MDLFANEIGMDTAAIRRKNFLPPDAVPVRQPVRASGPRSTARRSTSTRATTSRPWTRRSTMPATTTWRRRRPRRRTAASSSGMGLSTYIEVCGVAPSKWIGAVGEGWGAAMWESSNIKVHLTGKVIVTMGTQPQGQGHETTYAQIIGHELGVPMEDIVVQHSDTQGTPFGYGSYGSRTSIGRQHRRDQGGRQDPRQGPPLRRPHARGVARRHRGRSAPSTGSRARPRRRRRSRRSPSRSISGSALPAGMEPYLDETAYYDTPNCTWPVRDPHRDRRDRRGDRRDRPDALHRGRRRRQEDQPDDRRRPAPRRDRPGRRPGALGGRVYGDDGQLLSGSMMDYALPRASWLPNFELDETVTPSPVNPLGVKGVGEAGCIASTAAVANAVNDALAPLGIRHLDMPFTAQTVWRAIQIREGRPGMIPAAFDYPRAAQLDEALGLVGDAGAKVIAGGMSLLPLMKLRLASAERLVDIGRLDELKGVRTARRRAPRGRRADDLRRAGGVAGTPLRPDPRRPAGHRRRPGPQPRDRRRRGRPLRSGVRPAGRPARPRRGDRRPIEARREDDHGRRVLHGRVHDGARARTSSSPRSACRPARRCRVRVRGALAAGVRLLDRRRRRGRDRRRAAA